MDLRSQAGRRSSAARPPGSGSASPSRSPARARTSCMFARRPRAARARGRAARRARRAGRRDERGRSRARSSRTAVDAFGGVDIAREQLRRPAARYSPRARRRATCWRPSQLLLVSVVRLTGLCLPYLEQSPAGRIVNVTSSTVREPIDNLALSNAIRPGRRRLGEDARARARAEGHHRELASRRGASTPSAIREVYPDGPTEADLATIPLRRLGTHARDRRRRRVPLLGASGVRQRHRDLVDGGLTRGSSRCVKRLLDRRPRRSARSARGGDRALDAPGDDFIFTPDKAKPLDGPSRGRGSRRPRRTATSTTSISSFAGRAPRAAAPVHAPGRLDGRSGARAPAAGDDRRGARPRRTPSTWSDPSRSPRSSRSRARLRRSSQRRAGDSSPASHPTFPLPGSSRPATSSSPSTAQPMQHARRAARGDRAAQAGRRRPADGSPRRRGTSSLVVNTVADPADPERPIVGITRRPGREDRAPDRRRHRPRPRRRPVSGAPVRARDRPQARARRHPRMQDRGDRRARARRHRAPDRRDQAEDDRSAASAMWISSSCRPARTPTERGRMRTGCPSSLLESFQQALRRLTTSPAKVLILQALRPPDNRRNLRAVSSRAGSCSRPDLARKNAGWSTRGDLESNMAAKKTNRDHLRRLLLPSRGAVRARRATCRARRSGRRRPAR